jgi:hypothetical protein
MPANYEILFFTVFLFFYSSVAFGQTILTSGLSTIPLRSRVPCFHIGKLQTGYWRRGFGGTPENNPTLKFISVGKLSNGWSAPVSVTSGMHNIRKTL